MNKSLCAHNSEALESYVGLKKEFKALYNCCSFDDLLKEILVQQFCMLWAVVKWRIPGVGMSQWELLTFLTYCSPLKIYHNKRTAPPLFKQYLLHWRFLCGIVLVCLNLPLYIQHAIEMYVALDQCNASLIGHPV